MFRRRQTPPTVERTPIFDAVLRSDYEAIAALLTDRADLDIYDALGMTPLLYAVFRGDVHAARLLLEAGANPNMAQEGEPESTPLWHAAEDFGLFEIAQLLRDHGA